MKNNKSPGLDGFPIEFFKFFWIDLKEWIYRYVTETFEKGLLTITCNRGVITCIPKSNKDRTLLKNWRPITLLNSLYKIISTCITSRLKKTLDTLIHDNQSGFIPGRNITVNTRLLYDILLKQ